MNRDDFRSPLTTWGTVVIWAIFMGVLFALILERALR